MTCHMSKIQPFSLTFKLPIYYQKMKMKVRLFYEKLEFYIYLIHNV